MSAGTSVGAVVHFTQCAGGFQPPIIAEGPAAGGHTA
jgi:hypothetical protein